MTVSLTVIFSSDSLAVRLCDLAVQAHLDVRRGRDRVDQVLRHALLEARAAVEERHPLRVAGEEDRRLAGRVRPADDHHVLVAARHALAARAAVVHAAAGQLLDAGRVQAAVVDPGGDDDRLRAQPVVTGQLHEPRRPALVDGGHLLHGQELGAEAGRLRRGPAGEVGAGEAHGEAEVVLDPRALAGLAARRLALDQRRSQALRRAVDGGREPGRPAADDHEVVELELRPPPHARPLGESGHARAVQRRRRRGRGRAAARRRRRRRRAAGGPRRRARRRASGTAPGFGPGSRGRRATRATSGGRPPGCGRRRRAHPPARRRAGRPRPGRAARRADPRASAGSGRATPG